MQKILRTIFPPEVARWMTESGLWWGVLALMLLFAGWSILKIRSFVLNETDSRTDDAMMLLHLRELHREGEISDEEYRKVKGRFGDADRFDPASGSDFPADLLDVESEQETTGPGSHDAPPSETPPV